MTKPTREEVETWWRIAIRFFALPYDGSFKLMKESHLALLDENERLKLTLTDERSLYADLAEKNERLKAKCEQADILGTAWQEDLRKMERQAAVVEAANDLAKLSQDGYQTAEEWTALMGKLIDALAQFGGDTYE
jgi:hypothetical protein